MKIIVSACLLGENCKYNGGNNKDERLLGLQEKHTVIPVCPEVLGGLPTPRKPAEIVNGTVSTADGLSVDDEFRKGAMAASESPKTRPWNWLSFSQEVQVADVEKSMMALSTEDWSRAMAYLLRC